MSKFFWKNILDILNQILAISHGVILIAEKCRVIGTDEDIDSINEM
jgi:hypothetical protein